MCKFVQFFSIALCLSVAVLLENSARFMNVLFAQDVSAPKSEEATEESNPVLFYLYPSLARDASEIVQREQLKYSQRFDNVDISIATWSRYSTRLVTKRPSEFVEAQEPIEVEGTPVTLEDFKKTWNYRNKSISHVRIADKTKLSLDFKDWTLYKVNFYEAADVSHCDFEDATLLDCILDNNLSFEQFASTWNYKHNRFEKTRFTSIDLSGWNFADKDVSKIEFASKGVSRKGAFFNPEKKPIFKNALFFDCLGKGTGVVFSNVRRFEPLLFLTMEFPTFLDNGDLYESQNYREKDCRFMHLRFQENVDLTDQNLEFSFISGNSEATLKRASISNAHIHVANAKEISETKNYQEGDLCGCSLSGDLTSLDFSKQNLTGGFIAGNVQGVSFKDAVISFCNFKGAKGLTIEQLEETWNFKTGNLKGIITPWEDWNSKYSQ